MDDGQGYLSRGISRLVNVAALAIGIGIGIYATNPPGREAYAQVPPDPNDLIEYWDAPTGCDTCDPNRGAFINGLHFDGGASVELMMDCDGNGTKENNVNVSGFPAVVCDPDQPPMCGAYDVVGMRKTPTTCGWDPNIPYLISADVRIGGLMAYPRNLPFNVPGDFNQQRLDAYGLVLDMPNDNTLTWNTQPEFSAFDIIRWDAAVPNRRLNTSNATPIACNYSGTSISGTNELNEIPLPGEVFYFVIRPRNTAKIPSVGNYNDGNAARGLPISGDCPQ
ncbi:MAG: hypothetical protein HY518_05470 [Candidatus Aenigmarchaeota archaeon]|nr:hypothetical protein [Candidatus Aenigmarchaeota archaeon]